MTLLGFGITSKSKGRSRFPSGMTNKRARAKAKAEADSLVCFVLRRNDGLRFGGEAAIP
jgi:hypothetical protein